MNTFLTEVEVALRKTENQNDTSYRAFRSKTTHWIVLGHRLPVLHSLVKSGFSFYTKSPETILSIWNHVWNHSNIHEAMSLPLFYYRIHKLTFGEKEWRVMKHWVDRVENWEHSDALSALYSVFFEQFPTMVLPTLRQWNRSDNPWKQRASIVSLIYYATPKRTAPPVDLVLELVEPLLPSKDMYVNKAIGWTLREAYKLYPKDVLSFIQTSVDELSPHAFSYATEKVDKKIKAQLKKQREISRLRHVVPTSFANDVSTLEMTHTQEFASLPLAGEWRNW